MCLSCEDIARQICAMVRTDGEFLAIFCVLHFQRAAYSTFQTCILNSHSGHTMCKSIQSATAEIRRGKKERKKKERTKKQDENIMSASATQGGHNKCCHSTHRSESARSSCERIDRRCFVRRLNSGLYRLQNSVNVTALRVHYSRGSCRPFTSPTACVH